jgi:hypothetical protein
LHIGIVRHQSSRHERRDAADGESGLDRRTVRGSGRSARDTREIKQEGWRPGCAAGLLCGIANILDIGLPG